MIWGRGNNETCWATSLRSGDVKGPKCNLADSLLNVSLSEVEERAGEAVPLLVWARCMCVEFDCRINSSETTSLSFLPLSLSI